MSDEQRTSPPYGDVVARWQGFEQVFSQNGYERGARPWPQGLPRGVAEPTPGLLELRGSSRPEVVLTASHAANHVRDGELKLADRGTGGLAILLAELTGCTALVAAGTAGDANYDDAHPLKDRLAGLRPAVVIDLHGMRSRSESDVDLGTGSGDVPAGLLDTLGRSDLRVTTNAVFGAMRSTTVTAYAQARGVPAVQVEVGAHLRPPSDASDDLRRLVTALVTAIESTASPDPSSALTAVPVAIASGLPLAVVHPDALAGLRGPVPVTVTADDRSVVAWAWSATAVGVPEEARGLSPGQIGVGRRLREKLDDASVLSLVVPRIVPLRTRAALARDLPAADEVHVSPGDLVAGIYLLVHDGVTAWVRAVPRAHVPTGQIRLGYQLRLLIASDSTADDGQVALVAATPAVTRREHRDSWLRRLGGATDTLAERLWRALFRAPEFAARIMQAHAGDDGAAVVSLHPAVFDRIGVEPGQQVLVRWGGREVAALAVADHDPPETGAPPDSIKRVQRVNRLWPHLPEGMSPHVVVRMSAQLRGDLGAPVATVVTVRRRLRPVLVRNLNSLVVPLASLVLAGAALPDPHWPTLGLGTALMSVFALARLRIPRPRRGARVDNGWVGELAGPEEISGTGLRR
ncbi:N-formylglutamate amidohydrolase [Promicromonospora thailandica]|uniref:N-formylglutamate amidohydrolase n=1 Tax=Promicromonospora thailandica TaxID=765201 RepID=A0A9X2G1Y9_9MICO|nr:N-formylglutamate amidohydrolase [Promicromonospora thailandica]